MRTTVFDPESSRLGSSGHEDARTGERPEGLSIDSFVVESIRVTGVARTRESLVERISDLDRLSPAELTTLEERLAQQHHYSNGEALFYAGRNCFRALPRERVERLRLERQYDERTLALQGASQILLAPDAAVFSVGGQLGRRVASLLGVRLGNLTVQSFANSETEVKLGESVRDKHVFVIASPSDPVNDALVALSLVCQALKLNEAKKVTAIIPYFAYSRQDRQLDGVRSPISARFVTDTLEAMGVERIVTVDVHAKQIGGFFRGGAFENLSGLSHMVPKVLAGEHGDLLVVSPDEGGSKRATAFARLIESDGSRTAPVVGMSKFRPGPGQRPKVTLTADPDFIKGKDCILVDDMIDTGGSILAAGNALKNLGAARVVVCATHPVCSRDAISRLRAARTTAGNPVIDRLYVTDTQPIFEPRDEFLNVISLSPLLAEVIRRLSKPGSSLSELSERRDLGVLLPAVPGDFRIH